MKRILGHFLKVQPLKLEIQDGKRCYKTYTKNKFQKIKQIIENLQDELYQLENKQANGAKLCVNIIWELEGKRRSKTFFKVLERKSMRNQTISELHIGDNKSKHSSNLSDILKSAKNFCEKFYTKETTFKAATTTFLNKVSNRKKISSEQFLLCEAKISLDEVTKSINSETKNKSPGNYSLTVEFYKHFSN